TRQLVMIQRLYNYFFFSSRRRHTRFSRDWSSDVCSSDLYREKTQQINRLLAERYGDHPALIMWHVSNEYGGECHCDLCQQAFRTWLKKKYNHDLGALNHAWWAGFWSHRFSDWEQIESPAPHGEYQVHGHNLDWK